VGELRPPRPPPARRARADGGTVHRHAPAGHRARRRGRHRLLRPPRPGHERPVRLPRRGRPARRGARLRRPGLARLPAQAGRQDPAHPEDRGRQRRPRCHHGPDQLREWWDRQPDANIGLAAGVAPGARPRLRPTSSPRSRTAPTRSSPWNAASAPCPRRCASRPAGSAGSGSSPPDPRIRNGVKLLPGLDTRAAGGYVAAPPSVHPSGRRYRWIVPPGEAELAQAPEWLVALLEPVELPEPVPAAAPGQGRRPLALRRGGRRQGGRAGGGGFRRAAVRHAGARGVRARPAGRGRGAAPRRGQGRAGRGRAAHALGHRPGQARQALQAVDQARGRVARRPGAGRRRGQAPRPGARP
jgi:hypothetical protein